MTVSGPALVVAGGRKCGTTWLDRCLREHPNLCLPRLTKEVFFFDRFFHRGFDWYLAQFPTARADQLLAEVAPSYFASREAPLRLQQTLPNARVVVLLRDPTRRAWSDFQHAVRKGDVPPWTPLRDAIQRRPSIRAEGHYDNQAHRWFGAMGRDSVKVFIAEEVRNDPDSFFGELFRWLEVPEMLPPSRHIHRSGLSMRPRSHRLSGAVHRSSRFLRKCGASRVVNWAKAAGAEAVVFRKSSTSQLSPDDEQALQELREHYKPHIRGLEELLGRQIPTWDR